MIISPPSKQLRLVLMALIPRARCMYVQGTQHRSPLCTDPAADPIRISAATQYVPSFFSALVPPRACGRGAVRGC